MIMAQEFSLQRVLVTEERSGHYGRGSMGALKGKRTSQGMPGDVCYLQASYMESIRVLKDRLPFFMLPATWREMRAYPSIAATGVF